VSFATPVFLWVFMPTVLAVYWILPARRRNAVLAVASFAFYAYGAKGDVVLLASGVTANYVAGVAIDRAVTDRVRNRLLAAIVVLDVGVLAYWKYAGFLSRQVSELTRFLGAGSTGIIEVALPIGVSFFTFHMLSYVIDVWRRRSPALHRPLDFATYIAMFPQLIAGPIVRYHEISDQLAEVRANRMDDFTAGFPRFALGLFKKVVIADTIAPVANAVFALPGSELTTASAWIGVIAYTLQIYFDFSGYTDMAIGLARMFGFRFPENFARPYSSLSMTDFWRRWHMSLSRWFRDYVYVPLGGNRGSSVATYRNLYIVFFLTGLWHGAAWTFVLWGLYHGTLLVLERRSPRLRDAHALEQPASRLRHVWMRARVLLLVMVGWVLFRAPGISEAFSIVKAMFVPSGFGLDLATNLALTHERIVVMALASTVVLLPRSFVLGRVLDIGHDRFARTARLGVVLVGAPYAALLIAAGTFSPFLYFQF
jgi:alginate O-acetyltransferase complex protein AlgI